MLTMFQNASGLTHLDLSEWDVSSVTRMDNMFYGASSLTCVGDLSKWETGSVTSMYGMFRYASSLTDLDSLSNWETTGLTNMARMFHGASGLTSLDLSGWNTSSVTSMVTMFQNASSLTSLDLSGWDTGNVTNMTSMFLGAAGLRQLTLGEDFHFVNPPAPSLPPVSNNATYTGNWQNVGGGTVHAPVGAFELSSAQLMSWFDGSIMADTWVWQRTPFWAISLPGNHTFPSAMAGYGPQTPHSVTVTNTGNQPTGDLTITLSGANPGAFMMSSNLLTTIAINGTAGFTVVPNAGLAAGLYTATVTVSGANGISETFAVSFTVTAQSGTNPTSPTTPTNPTNPTDPTSPTNPPATDPTEPPTNPAPPPPATNPSEPPIEQVSPPYRYDYEIHLAYMFGNNRGNFRPLAAISRAEVATVLVRTQLTSFTSPEAFPAGMDEFGAFADVQPDNWFYYYIAWAYYAGLVNGDPACADGYRSFRPNDPITRQEFAAMVSRLTELHEPDDGFARFYDWDQVSNWAKNHVYTVFQTGRMAGNEQNLFRPLSDLSRAEVAPAINRALGRIDGWPAFESVNLRNPDDARDFPDVSETGWYVPSVIAAANDYRLGHDNPGTGPWMEILPHNVD